MSPRILTILVPAALMLGGCADRDPAAATATTADPDQQDMMGDMHGHDGGMMMNHQEMMGMCPMQIPQTQVAVEEVENGIAVLYRTDDEEQVEQLRQRVRRMSEHHQQMQERHATRQEGGQHDMMMMPQSTAAVEDVEGGARVVLRPKDQGQLDDLRRQVRLHAERMQDMPDGCPMMSMMSNMHGDPAKDEAVAQGTTPEQGQ